MSDALAIFDPGATEQVLTLATTLSKSGLLPKALQNRPADVLVVLLAGRELGIGPMQALRGIYVVDGKPILGAELMAGVAIRSRECEYFRLVRSSATEAVYETKRRGSDRVELKWTIDQAKAAGLVNKNNWRSFPDAMLRARCAGALARAVYPDILNGVYTPDEAEEFGGPPAPVPTTPERDVTPPESPTATGRRTAEVKARLAAKVVKPEPEEAQVAPQDEIAKQAEALVAQVTPPVRPKMDPEVAERIKHTIAARGITRERMASRLRAICSKPLADITAADLDVEEQAWQATQIQGEPPQEPEEHKLPF